MQWAAGLSVDGVPDNPYPADILNLSLGGTGSCSSSYQTLISKLAGMGVLVVASAGNESGPVDSPGNCSGVLAVAGLRNVGTKVGYSSLGAEVGIAAPAGNCVVTSDTCLRPIDTTSNAGTTVPAQNIYTDQTNPSLGTSFSAPIVAGIAALMRSVNGNLTPAQLIAPHPVQRHALPGQHAESAGVSGHQQQRRMRLCAAASAAPAWSMRSAPSRRPCGRLPPSRFRRTGAPARTSASVAAPAWPRVTRPLPAISGRRAAA